MIFKKRIRDKQRNPYGMIVALNENQLGYSICNIEAGDKYDDNVAFKIACSRARSQKITNYEFWKTVIELEFKRNNLYEPWTRQLFDTIEHQTYNSLPFESLFVLRELYYLQQRVDKYFKK
jgi:hypothetical protein